MNQVVDNVRNLTQYKAYEKGLELNIIYNEDEPIYYGDPLRIGQVLINLINNAVKFTSKGEVTLSIKNEDDNIVCFSVKDTGIGDRGRGSENPF